MALRDERGRRIFIGGGVDFNAVKSIAITTQPTNTQYAGNPLDLTGLVITATKNDGTTEVVTDKVICNREVWGSAVETVVTFGYKEKACYWTVTPTAVVPASMTVKTNPTKTTYADGEDVDTTGMVLTVTYSDTSEVDIESGFEIDPTVVATGDTSVGVSYTEGEVTVETSFAITVTE